MEMIDVIKKFFNLLSTCTGEIKFHYLKLLYKIEWDEWPTVSMYSSLVDVLQRCDMTRVDPRLWAHVRRLVNSKQKRLDMRFKMYCHEVSKLVIDY